jgi:hypothetical protein
MLTHQVVLIADDDLGSGTILTSRYLLENAKVVLLSNINITEQDIWYDEIETGQLMVLPLEIIQDQEEQYPLFRSLLHYLGRIDAIILCESHPISLPDPITLSKQNKIVMTFTQSYLSRTGGASLVFVHLNNDSVNDNSVLTPIELLSNEVEKEAEQLIRRGIRHNLLIHESSTTFYGQAKGISSAIFLTSDLSENVYGQVIWTRDKKQI